MKIFEILTFDFYLGEKDNCKLLFISMQAHHNEKMKELVYPSILRVASKFVGNDKATHRLRKNSDLLA